MTPVSVKALQYTIAAFPFKVEVTFENGEQLVYSAEDLKDP